MASLFQNYANPPLKCDVATRAPLWCCRGLLMFASRAIAWQSLCLLRGSLHPNTPTPTHRHSLIFVSHHPAERKWKLIGIKKNIKEIQEGAKKPFFWGISDACCERCGCISTSMMVLFQLNWLEPSVWDMCWSQSGFLSHRMYPHFHFFNP